MLTVKSGEGKNTRDKVSVSLELGQELLESDGIVASGVRATKRATLVNQYVPSSAPATGTNQVSYRAAHINYSLHDPSIVDRVALSSTRDDMLIAKLLLRQTRVPERGDKFSSRHGQKGYCPTFRENSFL